MTRGASPLLDPEEGCCAMDVLAGRDPIKMAAERAAKFIFRGLLILLWLYLFDSMKRYAISYTGGDTWFTTFAAIVVSIPIAEIFCILGQTLVAPILPLGSPTPCRDDCVCACNTAANGKVPEEEMDASFLDLENGPMEYTTAPLQQDVITKIIDTMIGMTETEKAALDVDAASITKCLFRGLLVLLWVYLVDLMRRYVTTHEIGEVFFTMCPLGILAVCVSAFFCFLMESFGDYILSLKVSY